MTREEAIKRLKEIDIRDALQEDYDALYMAIEALEQEPILDKIRAEIKQLPIYGAKFLNGYFTVHVDVDEVLQIIDKYRGEVDCRECKAEYDCYECEKYEESEDKECLD